jgi:hypothetical protein
MSPADLSATRLRPTLSAARDGHAPLLYGLLAALLSAAVTALLLGGAA